MTFKSKALKPKKFRWQMKEEAATFFKNVRYYFLMYLVYPVTGNYRILKERLGRSLAYARYGWLNYDFDMAYAWDIFGFKLKRLRECLKNGHAVQEPEDMKALDELIKIVGRLREDDYERPYYKAFEKKWSKIESRTEPTENSNSVRWITWRKNCPENASKKVQNQERKDLRKCLESAEKDRVRDLERMKDILVKHSRTFWD